LYSTSLRLLMPFLVKVREDGVCCRRTRHSFLRFQLCLRVALAAPLPLCVGATVHAGGSASIVVLRFSTHPGAAAARATGSVVRTASRCSVLARNGPARL
jgi:hypothetical protein